jgi:hypothetical protein
MACTGCTNTLEEATMNSNADMATGIAHSSHGPHRKDVHYRAAQEAGSRLHVIIALIRIKLSLFLGGRLLILLELGNEVVKVESA